MTSRATQAAGSLAMVLLASILLCQPTLAAPTTGAYATDPQHEWVQDQVLENISTVNMILCFMSNLRADAKVNAGNYLALIDEQLCNSDNRGGSETSGSSGASATVTYARAIVNSTRASNSDPMLVKVWIRPQQQESQSQLIYAYASVSGAPSSTNPNGVFTMSFCGVSGTSSTPLTDPCQFNGTMTAQSTNITFYETGTEPGRGGSYSSSLNLTQSGTDTGSGRVRKAMGSNSMDLVFAYNPDYYQRGRTSDSSYNACFDRRRTSAGASTWRYGVYNNDGSRFEVAQPGFPVTYTDSNNFVHYGYAGFYGIFLPSSVLSTLTTGATLTKRDPSTNQSIDYTLTKAGGKLTKLTKNETSLGAIKGQRIRVWMSGGEAELSWDGTTLSKTRTFSGPNSTPCTSNCTVTAADLRSSFFFMLMGFSESAGGEVAIIVPSSGEFSDSTQVSFRTRENVTPTAMASLSLKCISRCLKGGLTASDFSQGNSPFIPGETANNFGVPIAVGSAVTYTVSSGMLQYNGSNVDASSISSSALQTGGYQWGVQSGRLIDANDTTSSYPQARCTQQGGQSDTGDYLCPWLVDQATTVYQWESGPNAWNQYLGLEGNGTAVTFTPPVNFPFTVSTTNTNLPSNNPLIGSQLNLQYNGFGELHGIPGSCVNPRTNQEVNCGEAQSEGGQQVQTRYVPKFSITDGTSITASSSNAVKWVKYLEREVRFNKFDDSTNCASLTLPDATLTLPNSAGNPRSDTGAEPTLSTNIPAVIHGVVQ